MSESALIRQFREMPRALRWLAITVAGIVLFYAWLGTLGALASRWSDSADAIEAQVARLDDTSRVRDRLRSVKAAVVAIGTVEPPGSELAGRTALTRACNEVLKSYPVSNDKFDLGGGGDKLPDDLARGITRQGQSLSRLTATVDFESSPEDAIAIIADLEQRPEIESVSKTRISAIGGRKVKVSLTLESWVERVGRSRI